MDKEKQLYEDYKLTTDYGKWQIKMAAREDDDIFKYD
jgi:hypothetical protein